MGIKRVADATAAMPGAESDTEMALRRTRRLFINRDNLRAAIRTVVDKTLEARDTQLWGPGTSCASDSRKFGSWSANFMTDWHQRYAGPGIMVYWHVEWRAGEAARRKNDPADLINVALEKLVEGSFELPGYSTLEEMAARIREEVNSSIFATVAGRIGPAGAARLDETLQTGGPGTKSAFNRLKKTAPRPSWTNFRHQIDQVRWTYRPMKSTPS